MKKDLMQEDLERAKQEFAREPKEINKREEKTRTKKIITIAVSVFLIILMLSFIYLSAPVYTYIYGIAGSSKINDDTKITFKNTATVVFNEETLTFLQQLYDPLGDESAVCLKGEITNKKYEVRSYYEPAVFERAWNMVSHAPCDEDTIIMLHTHPLKRCTPSKTDENTLRRTQINNPEIIMLVMCGNKRFSAII